MTDPENTDLGRIHVRRLSGEESFRLNGRPDGAGGGPASFNVLDFWRWSTSDLVMNTTRGVFAEYIVARAIGVPTDGVRNAWMAYDLLRPADGLRVEVKSAAYVQSWFQAKPSHIQFVVPKRLGWDPETNKMDSEARRHADVYVFALLAEKDQAKVDPLDLSQWQFWAVPTKDLDARQRSQHSITLPSLQQLAGEPVGFAGLRAAVDRAFELQRLAASRQGGGANGGVVSHA